MTNPRDFEPSDEQREVVDRMLAIADRFALRTPLILAAEMSRPLNRVGSTVLLMAAPMVEIVLGTDAVHQLGLMLERRESIEYLLRRLEEGA